MDLSAWKFREVGADAVKGKNGTSPAAHRLCHLGVHRFELRGVKLGPKFGGMRMPTTSTLAPEALASSAISSDWPRRGDPRRPSLPPSSITTSVGLRFDQQCGQTGEAAGRGVAADAGVDHLRCDFSRASFWSADRPNLRLKTTI